MATPFKQVADNAVSTTATSYAATGVTSTTAATGTGSKFPTPGNGFILTIWTGALGSDPGADANMEEVTVTARSGDVLTHSATTKTHASPVNIGALDVAQNTTDLQTAVNSIENGMLNSSLVSNEVPVGLVNGSNTAYTTASNMATGSLRVFRNGIRLKGGGVDFTQGSNNAFTMTTAPNTGDTLLVDYNVSATGFSVGTNSTISSAIPTGAVDSSNTSFSFSRAYIAGSLEVYIDGVHQRRGTDYTESSPSGGTFNMVTAPVTGQSITCNYQFNLNPSSNADTVDGIHASSTATAGQLYPLGSDLYFPASVLNGHIWWEELGRASLSVAGNTLTISSFTARKYLKIILSAGATGGTIAPTLRFNNDSATNYSLRYSDEGAAASTVVSGAQIAIDPAGALAAPVFVVADVINVAANEKIANFNSSSSNTAGAANAPTWRDAIAKWANTSAQISRIDIGNTGTGNLAIGTEVIVLGHD